MNQMPDTRELNIVDADDVIIGVRTREDIHQHGLRHRETHVWFYTPKGEVILQHRAKDKDTYPNLLDATVSGHVEIGASYESTAIQETLEETGVTLKATDLTLIEMLHSQSFDTVTQKTNNAIRAVYAHLYRSRLEDLVAEPGKIIGFELWDFAAIFNASPAEAARFIPFIFAEQDLAILRKIQGWWQLQGMLHLR